MKPMVEKKALQKKDIQLLSLTVRKLHLTA